MTATVRYQTGQRVRGVDRAVRSGTEAFRELAAVSRRMCETAVDATDIAVMLEASGINDAIAARVYSARDAQDLAERLLRAIPTRPGRTTHAGSQRIDPADAARLIWRGALYAAPGAFYLAIAADFHSAWAGLAVVAATATGWAASQIIGILAHRLTVRTGRGNTRAVLRRILVISCPVAFAVGAASAPAVGIPAACVLTAQVLFASGAAILLFHDADRVLAYCVIPGAMAAVLLTVDWPSSIWNPPVLVASAAVATAVVTCAAAWTWHGAAPSGTRGEPVRYPTARELVGCLGYVLYGLLCAAALAFAPVVTLVAPVVVSADNGPGLAVLPIVIVMGYGEWEIRRLRSACGRCASTVTALSAYRRRAFRYLATLQIRVITAISLATVLVAAAMGAAAATGAPHVLTAAATVALGCAVLTGLVGCALGRPMATCTALLAAFVIVAAASAVIGPFDPRLPGGYMIACLVLLAVTTVAAVHAVRQPAAVIT